MARPRPELKGWSEGQLDFLKGATPREWVSAILSSIWLPDEDLPSRRLKDWYRGWTFGQVREAIRREVERRGMAPAQAAALASLRAARGLKDLEGEGVLLRREGRYRMKEERVWDDLTKEALTKCFAGVSGGKLRLSARLSRPRGVKPGRVSFTVRRKGGVRPVLKIEWSVEIKRGPSKRS